MKRLFVSICLLAFAVAVPAQMQKKPPLSPPAKASVTIDGKTITIDYSSPRVRGREGKIFTSDGLISHDPHYPVWRAGANAATTLHTDADIKLGGLDVPAGTYTLFVNISDPDKWVLIVSTATGEWGLAYDSTKDLGTTAMTMSKPSSMVEDLVYNLTDDGGKSGTLTLTWENVSASVPITVQ
ncbi:MAG TPA: DUF2911 domain-containing protein [Terracidiphilus sp.]|nr:DUF2911 domain-containing protein [Terracidiphilus sp.]